MHYVANDFFLVVFDTRVEVEELCCWVMVFIKVEISPSLPKISHQVEVPVALVVDEELVLDLPALLSSHVVAQLEAEQQLQGF